MGVPLQFSIDRHEICRAVKFETMTCKKDDRPFGSFCTITELFQYLRHPLTTDVVLLADKGEVKPPKLGSNGLSVVGWVGQHAGIGIFRIAYDQRHSSMLNRDGRGCA